MLTIAAVTRLWRYPVKSLKRESLATAHVDCDGLRGDRSKALFVHDGHARIQKTYRGKENNLLHTITTTDAAQNLAGASGVKLKLNVGERYFDAAPISIVLDSWIAEAEQIAGRKLDVQRFRPNIFAHVEGGFRSSESALVGRALYIGLVVLRVRQPIRRCVTITYDVESGQPDPAVLRALTLERENTLGIYCDVVAPGRIQIGDSIQL